MTACSDLRLGNVLPNKAGEHLIGGKIRPGHQTGIDSSRLLLQLFSCCGCILLFLGADRFRKESYVRRIWSMNNGVLYMSERKENVRARGRGEGMNHWWGIVRYRVNFYVHTYAYRSTGNLYYTLWNCLGVQGDCYRVIKFPRTWNTMGRKGEAWLRATSEKESQS